MQFKLARIKAGMTAKAAAKRLGIHPTTLSAIENGHKRQVTGEILWRMASLYGCPVAQLMEALYGPAETGVTA